MSREQKLFFEWGIPFVEAVLVNCGLIYPTVAVLTKQAITPHWKTAQKTVMDNCFLHVVRGAGTEMAARAADVCCDAMMKIDDGVGDIFKKSGRFCGGGVFLLQSNIAVLAPWLDVADFGKEG